jgi:hypothetical protein
MKAFFKSSLIIFWLFFITCVSHAQTQNRPMPELYKEVSDYVKTKSKEYLSLGKKMDSERRESLEREKKALAKKYATEAATQDGFNRR